MSSLLNQLLLIAKHHLSRVRPIPLRDLALSSPSRKTRRSSENVGLRGGPEPRNGHRGEGVRGAKKRKKPQNYGGEMENGRELCCRSKNYGRESLDSVGAGRGYIHKEKWKQKGKRKMPRANVRTVQSVSPLSCPIRGSLG